MDGTQQQRDNRTNTLSEEHVHSAIETVLATRVQSYEEFMSAFMVLTPDDVNQFAARRQPEERVVGQGRTSDALEQTSQLFQIAQTSPRVGEEPRSDAKQVEELEIEELGEDFIDERENLGSDDRKKSSKYTQVDNYIDEPDSESELLSEDGEIIDFDDSSSKYVASFDVGTRKEESTPRVPPVVTPEMLERVNAEGKTSVEERDDSRLHSSSLPANYPGEVETDEETRPSPGRDVHITQLPRASGNPLSSKTETKNGDIDEEPEHRDDVQPFSIDPDFDYDNVTLTPKWDPGHQPPSGT